jgi:hypothetical protein
VVADVVDDLQDLVVRGLAQASAELLQPDDPRLGGAEHQHRVQLREVEPLVEDVHGADHVQLAGREELERLRTRGGRLARMDGDRLAAVRPEVLGHEVGMALGDAEGHRPGAAALVELLEGVGRARVHGEARGEGVLVETGVAPWDVRIVHLVRDAEILEAAELLPPQAFEKVAPIDQVLLAEGQKVAAVRSLRGRGEAQHELRPEVLDELAVATGGGVVELVHDQVVEFVLGEALEIDAKRTSAVGSFAWPV